MHPAKLFASFHAGPLHLVADRQIVGVADMAYHLVLRLRPDHVEIRHSFEKLIAQKRTGEGIRHVLAGAKKTRVVEIMGNKEFLRHQSPPEWWTVGRLISCRHRPIARPSSAQ